MTTSKTINLRLTNEEAWEFIASSHTGIITTLRADGMPISLPVWFAAQQGSIVFTTPSRAKKASRLRRDSRAAFLVEAGEKWAELRAVHLTGHVEFIEDDEVKDSIDAAIAEKYAAYRTAPAQMPAASQARYANKTYLRLVPDEKVLSWDNRRLPVTP
jgi:PPOX class probable F420-dependent enzyme